MADALTAEEVHKRSSSAWPREERLALLDELQRLNAAILRHRNGEMLPPAAEEIARMREERAQRGSQVDGP